MFNPPAPCSASHLTAGTRGRMYCGTSGGRVFGSRDSGDGWQMLADGEPLPRLSGRLEDIVVDTSWLLGVRCAALDVLISYNRNNCLETDVLIKLVDEIESGKIEDSENELLGILLKALYPETWSVNEILRFLRMPKMDSTTGEYTDFWTLHVPRESTPDQICDLLDLVASGFGEYRSFMIGE